MSFHDSVKEFIEEDNKLSKLYIKSTNKTLIYKLLLHFYNKKERKEK